MAISLEKVQESLKSWGEIMITTGAGEVFELHIGDTEFDMENRLIILKSPQARYVIDGDDVSSITMHYGHREE